MRIFSALRKSQLAIALISALFITFFYCQLTKADVTGFFEIASTIIPQSTSSELSTVQIDFQNNLTFTLQVGVFGWSFHGHGGITGMEDIITSIFLALGPLRIEPQVVMAQAFQPIFTSTGLAIPVCLPDGTGTGHCDFFFVSYRWATSLTLLGVTLKNLAIYEDTTFPDPTIGKPVGATYGVQSQSFGFGDVVSFEGQTTGGISIKGATGLCGQNLPKKIKHHDLPYSVNPICIPGKSGKLPFFFDFESFSVTGVPIASGIVIGTDIECVTIFACVVTNSLSVNTGPIPFSAIVVLSDLLSLDIQSIAVSLTQGAGTLTLQIGSGGAVSLSTLSLALLLNPSTLPGRLNLTISGAPGVGITDLDVSFSVTRSILTATAIASFTGSSGVFSFSRLVAITSAQAGVVSLEARASFAFLGLESFNLDASVAF